MTPASFEPSTLYATEHGTVDWASTDQLRVALDGRGWALAPDALASLHEAVEPLAAQVYRCNCDCRWQLRIDEQTTSVLSTDEVLRLHALLDGAVAMLELESMLEEAAIERPAAADRR